MRNTPTGLRCLCVTLWKKPHAGGNQQGARCGSHHAAMMQRPQPFRPPAPLPTAPVTPLPHASADRDARDIVFTGRRAPPGRLPSGAAARVAASAARTKKPRLLPDPKGGDGRGDADRPVRPQASTHRGPLPAATERVWCCRVAVGQKPSLRRHGPVTRKWGVRGPGKSRNP